MSENRRNVTFIQQCWYPPRIHPLGQPHPQPQRRVLRTTWCCHRFLCSVTMATPIGWKVSLYIRAASMPSMEGVRSTLQDSGGNHKIRMIWRVIWPRKSITAHSRGFKQWLRGNMILKYTSKMMLLKQLWVCVWLIITKIKKYEIWISRAIFRDPWNIANLIRI